MDYQENYPAIYEKEKDDRKNYTYGKDAFIKEIIDKAMKEQNYKM